MLSPSTTEGECSCGKKSLNNNNRGFSSSSSSSSSSSNSSSITPSFSHLQQTPRNNKSMEDVWKDINLASLTDHRTSTHNHHHHPINTTTSNLQGASFHDFLTPPLTFTIDIDPPPTTTVSSKTTTSTSTSTSTSSSSLHSPPVTALSLYPLPQMFHFDPLGRHGHHHPAASKVDPLSSNPFQNSLSSSLGSIQSDIGNSRDRRNKRMMKNRESAARSRARKQAYTYELKQKVKHLEEENARLRRQQQQLCYTAANQQQKKRGNLYRTSTAPF